MVDREGISYAPKLFLKNVLIMQHTLADPRQTPYKLGNRFFTQKNQFENMQHPYRDLVVQCQHCDRTAQQALYKRYAPDLLSVCFRYAKDREEAEDILQEGFVKIFQKIGKYEFQGSFEGWMRRIVVNTAIDHIRRNKKRQLETDIEEAREVFVSEEAVGQLELEYLYQIIQDLPPGYQLVFNLYAIEGYSHREIGERMGITESTSRSQYTRARSLLMKKICEDRMESNIYKDAI